MSLDSAPPFAYKPPQQTKRTSSMLSADQLKKNVTLRVAARVLSFPWTYLLMGLAILELDLLTGRYLLFPIFFAIPVLLAAWFCSVRCAFSLAIVLPFGRFYIDFFLRHFHPPLIIAVNLPAQIALLVVLAYFVSRTSRQTKALQHEVHQLEGILNICMYCKRIQDEQGRWQQLESYIAHHSRADFSHGMCSECAQKRYPELFTKKPSA